ncbi:hypothetical protein ACFOYU_10120 [Microvirga sp. GCM10011540]|uniref:hypothetical protein n=1 Tax=Microvirga sp. GCM10011540 TaxID=3317338 RepID=UPI00361EE805
MLAFLVGVLGLIGGLGAAQAHMPGAAAAPIHGGVPVPQANAAPHVAAAHAPPAAVRPSHAPDPHGLDLCTSGCCCGMMCSAALPEPEPTSPLAHLLHGCWAAARDLPPNAVPDPGMLRPPKA